MWDHAGRMLMRNAGLRVKTMADGEPASTSIAMAQTA